MSVQKYKYYIGNEDNNELGMVISDIMNKAFNGVDTMTIKILTSPYRIDAANLLLNQPLWKERQSDSYIEFRGFITEVDTTETDKYNLTLQVKASTKILADLDSEITTEVLGRRKITSVEAAFIGDDSDDYEDFSNGYVASDHAVLIIPGNDPAFNNEVAEAVSATGGSSTSGVVANVNDGDAATGYKVTKGGVAALWGQIDGSSATIKASVVGARVRITCITALGTTQDHTATLQYYNNDTLAWVNIGDSFEVKKDETWGRLTWTAEITISGYVDTNEILDGADDWKIRLLVASAGTPGHSLKIRTITVDIYSDAKYNGASFPISSYSGDDTGMNVSVNPVTAGVETNDSYVVGQKDRDALISIFGLFSASDLKGMTIDVDANFSGYTARSFAGTNLIDVLEYFSDKQQAHWWFDHHNNIIAIYKESTLATDPTLREPTESDFSSYGYQKKVDQQVKSVTVKGATYKVGDQDNIDVEYKFPQIHDIPIPTTSLKNLILDKPEITSWTEVRNYATGKYNKLNADNIFVSLTPLAFLTYVMSDRITLTIDRLVLTTETITGIFTTYNVGDDLVTQSLQVGFQQTSLEKELGNRIAAMKKEINELMKHQRGMHNSGLPLLRKDGSNSSASTVLDSVVIETPAILEPIINNHMTFRHGIHDFIFSKTEGVKEVVADGDIDIDSNELKNAILPTPTITDSFTLTGGANPITVAKTVDEAQVEFAGNLKVVGGYFDAESVHIGDIQVLSEAIETYGGSPEKMIKVVTDKGFLFDGASGFALINKNTGVGAALNLGCGLTPGNHALQIDNANNLKIGQIVTIADEIRFANGSTYKVDATGDAIFKALQTTGSVKMKLAAGGQILSVIDTGGVDEDDAIVFIRFEYGEGATDLGYIGFPSTGHSNLSLVNQTTGDIVLNCSNGNISIKDPALIGDGGITNYAQFAADGEINLHGTARAVRDAWVPFNALRAPGTSPATYVDHGISGAWEFSDNTDDTIIGNIKFPNDMDKSVAPSMCVGWSTNTAVDTETATWQLEYLYTQVGEDTIAAAQATITVDSNAIAQANGLILATFPAMNIPNANDVCLHFRIKRLGAGGNDDLTDTAELHGVVMQYTSNKLGTAT